MLESIKDILYICVVVVSIVITFVSLIVNRIKAIKDKKNANTETDKLLAENEDLKSEIDYNQEILRVLTEFLPKAMMLAEEQPNLSGACKKLVAISDIMQKCSLANIDFGVVSDKVDNALEQLIDFSKEVNVK